MNAQVSQALMLSSAAIASGDAERILRALAKEIAKDFIELEDILKMFNISQERFETISQSAVFNNMLAEELKAWSEATNTPERIKLKYLGMIEASAPEFYAAMVGPGSLSDKVKLLQTVAKIAGMGQDNATSAGTPGNGIHISISLGNGQTMVKDVTPEQRSIDNTVNQDPLMVSYDEGYDDERDADEE